MCTALSVDPAWAGFHASHTCGTVSPVGADVLVFFGSNRDSDRAALSLGSGTFFRFSFLYATQRKFAKYKFKVSTDAKIKQAVKSDMKCIKTRPDALGTLQRVQIP